MEPLQTNVNRPTIILLIGALCTMTGTPTAVGETPVRPFSEIVFEQWHNGTIAFANQAAEAGVSVGGRIVRVPTEVQELRVVLIWSSPGNASDLHLRVYAPGESSLSLTDPQTGAPRSGMWSDEGGRFGAPDSPASVGIAESTWKRISCAQLCNWTVQAWPNAVVAGTDYTIHVQGYAGARGAAEPLGSVSFDTLTSDPRQTEIALGVAVATLGVGFILTWGHRFALWILAPRIRPENALDHPVRQRLYEIIRSRPGLFEKEFQDVIDLSWGTLVFHLAVLARAGVVETRKPGRHRCYFAKRSLSSDEMDAVALLRSSAANRVASELEEAPLARAELRRRLSLAEATTTWHLARLERNGLVKIDKTAHRSVSLSPLAIRALRIVRVPATESQD